MLVDSDLRLRLKEKKKGVKKKICNTQHKSKIPKSKSCTDSVIPANHFTPTSYLPLQNIHPLEDVDIMIMMMVEKFVS